MMRSKNEYISLKEASSISGYSSDYVGQLIRSGKLPGKQVYTNVSWVTTREALEEYMEERARPSVSKTRRFFRLISPTGLTRLNSLILWLGVVGMSLFALFLVYVLSVTIDHRIEKTYIEELERTTDI